MNSPVSLIGLTFKTIVVHTVTYTVMGILAMNLLHYDEQFARPEVASIMRQTTDALVMAGPLFQPIRGLIFALVFFPIRDVLFTRKNGWFVMFWILTGVGILSTFGPTPGSVEGAIYTLIPLKNQLAGWLEVVPQALLLSVILWFWVRHPEKHWLTWTLTGIFVLLVLMIVLGLVVTSTAATQV